MRSLARAAPTWMTLSLVLACGACSGNPTPRCVAQTDCAPSMECYRGFCLTDQPLPPGDGSRCPPLQIVCDHECVDTSTDEDHCGRCGDHCGGDDLCVDGDCQDGP